MIDGAFWFPRFPCLRAVVPPDTVLAWPEFWIDEGWVPVSKLYDGLCLVSGFSNCTETFYDAVARTAVEWDGTSSPKPLPADRDEKPVTQATWAVAPTSPGPSRP
ncbi:hypothetical protein [Nonomuraea sp. bgisy101]|uniref:hypothetical protein n=1 Tax=Nonomuraea sp. bgisy101 TaxID=3413784 RepID=UPI003D73CC50